jgi:hypothetical protein
MENKNEINDNNLVFHIGYHKTGSSFLQKQVFEKSMTFNRINQYSINRAIIQQGPFHFNVNQAKEFIKNESRENTINVFSNERLSGDPHSGGRDAKEIAERIKMIAPSAKILIVVREQISAILSSYSQYIRAVGSLSLSEYINSTSKRDIGRFRKEHFEYHHLITYYVELFGKEKVLCIPFELLAIDPHLFVTTILDFLKLRSTKKDTILKNIDYKTINASLNFKQIILKRYFNPFINHHQKDLANTYNFILAKNLYSFLNRLLQNKVNDKKSIKFNKSQKELIVNSFGAGFFENSNKKLQKHITYDLKSLGWFNY